MSSTSPDHTPFDPAGTDALVDPADPERWLSVENARAATRLLDGAETDRWLEWLESCDLWRPPEKHADPDAHLLALWAFLLRTVDAGWFTGCDWTEVERHPPVPLWLRLEPGREQTFGWLGSHVVAGVIASASQWMIDNWSASWTTTEEVGDTWASPCISVPGGRGFMPHVQLVGRVSKTLKAPPAERSDTDLRDLLYRHGPGTGTPVAETPPSTSDPEWALDAWENSDFNWGLSMDDWTAHNDEDRVAQLALMLAGHEMVDRCIHEDRELILIASALDHATLLEVVHTLWERTEPV